MNLIEKLGGYDKAKRAIENDVLKDYAPYTYETAQRKLLEYRRENNIFEVGDKVVSDFYQLDSIFAISHVCNSDEYIYSDKVFSKDLVFTAKDKLKGECRFLFSEIRHATDAEIKAGYRL